MTRESADEKNVKIKSLYEIENVLKLIDWTIKHLMFSVVEKMLSKYKHTLLFLTIIFTMTEKMVECGGRGKMYLVETRDLENRFKQRGNDVNYGQYHESDEHGEDYRSIDFNRVKYIKYKIGFCIVFLFRRPIIERKIRP